MYQVPGDAKEVPLYDPKTGEVAQEKEREKDKQGKKVQLDAPNNNKLMGKRSPETPRKTAQSNRLQKRTSKWLDEWNARKGTVSKCNAKGAAAAADGEGEKSVGKSLFKRKQKTKGK